MRLPNLARLGLGAVPGVHGLPDVPLRASVGRLAERSPGKDTTTGHWEFMGAILEAPFRTYAKFPPVVMERFDAHTGRPHLGNKPASGTAIIEELGGRHLQDGTPIVYTSADSVFQIATHVDAVPLEQLYDWCEAAREILQGEHAVARVIARPFEDAPAGAATRFRRIGSARRDYSLAPPRPTVLDAIEAAGLDVIGVGKIGDIYAGAGITEVVKTRDNDHGVDATLEQMARRPNGLIFTNLVEFDSLYGHRRDPRGYARALADFDARLPELLAAVAPGDALLLVSDHGNDPTWVGTDHTREYGLLVAFSPGVAPVPLGTRGCFCDVGATVAELLGVAWDGPGTSFAALLR